MTILLLFLFLKEGDIIFKKLALMLCLLLLVVGIASAAENNSTGDTLKTDADNGNEMVEIRDAKVMNENP